MEYTTQHGPNGSFCFEVRNAPAPGAQLKLRGGSTMTYKGPGPAGMLLCNDHNGIEQLIFPNQVERVVEAETAAAEAQPAPAAPNIPGLAADPSAFVRWAEPAGYDMTSHPLHFLFLNDRTAAARAGWNACRYHYKVDEVAAPVAAAQPVAVPQDVGHLQSMAHTYADFKKPSVWDRENLHDCIAKLAELAAHAAPAPTPQDPLEALKDSITGALEKAPAADVLGVLIGSFVGLTTELMRRQGLDASMELFIDGGKGRDVTIHAVKG